MTEGCHCVGVVSTREAGFEYKPLKNVAPLPLPCRLPVAVLADVPKAEMDAEIASRLRDAGMEVYTRRGSPTLPKDLATVAAQHVRA